MIGGLTLRGAPLSEPAGLIPAIFLLFLESPAPWVAEFLKIHNSIRLEGHYPNYLYGGS